MNTISPAIQKVIDDLKQYKGRFSINYSDIRANIKGYLVCPLAFLCRKKTKKRVRNTQYKVFEKVLELSRDEVNIFINASDTSRPSELGGEIRKALIKTLEIPV